LPADVYIRGFIKIYRSFIASMNPSLVEQFEKEHGFAQAHVPSEQLHPQKIWFTPRTIIS
jgi:cytoskeletal protein RodZ